MDAGPRCRARHGGLTMDADLPIGGTTGLCHETSAGFDLAVDWLVSTPRHQRPHPLIPHLRATFGLTAGEAIDAIRGANLRLARAS